jgi:hypothetical protein
LIAQWERIKIILERSFLSCLQRDKLVVFAAIPDGCLCHAIIKAEKCAMDLKSVSLVIVYLRPYVCAFWNVKDQLMLNGMTWRRQNETQRETGKCCAIWSKKRKERERQSYLRMGNCEHARKFRWESYQHSDEINGNFSQEKRKFLFSFRILAKNLFSGWEKVGRIRFDVNFKQKFFSKEIFCIQIW